MNPAAHRPPSSHATRPYTRGEEIANSLTHGLGVALAIAGLVVLVASAAAQGDAGRVAAFSIYGGTLVLLYLASTLYHGIPSAAVKRVLQRVDHAAIYALIAGSYTPFLLITLQGALGLTLLVLIWGVALAGGVLEFVGGRRWQRLSLAVYVLLGWTAVVIIGRVWTLLPGGAIALLFAGGVTYTAGIAFYLWRRLPYSHAIWHVFVLGGSICHFAFFLLYVLPRR